MRLVSVRDIVATGLCVGCGICQSVAGEDHIRMQVDKKGFLRPMVVGDATRSWPVIRQICPGLVVQHERSIGKRPQNRLWGPVLDICAGYALDEAVRWHGSSGGAISALACYLLETGQVDYVLQIGASLSNPISNDVYLSQSRQDVIKCAGSRYAPSAPLTNIEALLEQDDRTLAFVGKPCDVAALRAFLRLRPNLASKVVCTIAFLCTGTPSVHATRDVIVHMGADPSEVVDFRYRGQGWPGKARAETVDGKTYEMSYQDSWGKILGNHLQFRCKICADGAGELADITCGDAWYTRDGRPDFAERPGRSLVLSRTQGGQEIVSQSIEAGYLATEPFSLEELEVVQPYQVLKRRLVASRLLIIRLAGMPFPKYRGFHLIDNAIRCSLGENWNSSKGMLHRLRQQPLHSHNWVLRSLASAIRTSSRVKRLFIGSSAQ